MSIEDLLEEYRDNDYYNLHKIENITKLCEEIERLKSIIKEVREYVEKELSGYAPRDFRDLVDGYSVLEILDKEK